MKALRNVVLGTMMAGVAGVVAAADKAPEKAPEASIHFVNMKDSIHGWQPDGQTALWIEDAHRQWYYVKLMGPCNGLEFTARLGFEPKTMNSLDKFGYVVMPDNNQRCQISSLTKSDAPPKEKKGGKTGATK